MDTKKLNFAKNFTANAEISDLEKLGWYFEYDDTANAMNIEIDEAEKYIKETYHVELKVDEEGKTLWRFVNTQKSDNGIDEGSDNEATGDDKQTVKNLKQLHTEGKLWGEKNID